MCRVIRCKSERVMVEEKPDNAGEKISNKSDSLANLTVCDLAKSPKRCAYGTVVASLQMSVLKGKEIIRYTYSLITSGSWLVSTLKEQ